jgi:hypothetical protein
VIREIIHEDQPASRRNNYQITTKATVHAPPKPKSTIPKRSSFNGRRSTMKSIVDDVIQAQEVARYIDDDGTEVIREEVHLDESGGGYSFEQGHSPFSTQTSSVTRNSKPVQKRKSFGLKQVVNDMFDSNIVDRYIDNKGREVIKEEIHTGSPMSSRNTTASATKQTASRFANKTALRSKVGQVVNEAHEVERYYDANGREVIREEVHLDDGLRHFGSPASKSTSVKRTSMTQSRAGKGPSSTFKKSTTKSKPKPNRFNGGNRAETFKEVIHVNEPSGSREFREIEEYVGGGGGYDQEIVREEARGSGSMNGNYSGLRNHDEYFETREEVSQSARPGTQYYEEEFYEESGPQYTEERHTYR